MKVIFYQKDIKDFVMQFVRRNNGMGLTIHWSHSGPWAKWSQKHWPVFWSHGEVLIVPKKLHMHPGHVHPRTEGVIYQLITKELILNVLQLAI